MKNLQQNRRRKREFWANDLVGGKQLVE